MSSFESFRVRVASKERQWLEVARESRRISRRKRGKGGKMN